MKRFLSIALLLMFSVCLVCGLTVSASAAPIELLTCTLEIQNENGRYLYTEQKAYVDNELQDITVYVTETGLTWFGTDYEIANFISCTVDGDTYFPGDTIDFSAWSVNHLAGTANLTVTVSQADEVVIGWIDKFIPSLGHLIYDLGLNSVAESIFSVIDKIKDFFSSEHSLWKLFENSESMFQGLQNFWSFLGSMTNALPAPIITVIVFVFSTPLIVGFFKMF